MKLIDIVEIMFLSGLFFFFLGYKLKDQLQSRMQSFKNFFLKPKYLKAEGFISSDNNNSSKANKK